MCLGGKDDDPTQQPIRITQATDAPEPALIESKKSKEKKLPHHDGDIPDEEARLQANVMRRDKNANTTADAASGAVNKDAVRRKYAKRKNNTQLAPANFDCSPS